MVFFFVQVVAEEGKNICSGLEDVVLILFQRREPERCQKTKLRGEKLSEVSCRRGTCYCKGIVAAHGKIIKAIP